MIDIKNDSSQCSQDFVLLTPHRNVIIICVIMAGRFNYGSIAILSRFPSLLALSSLLCVPKYLAYVFRYRERVD